MKDKKEKKERVESRTITQIGRNKYLIKDAFQMWLAKKTKNRKTDEESYQRITGYYTTFSSLLEGVVREGVLMADGDTVTELLESLAKVEKDMRSTARKLGKELDNEH